MCEGDVDLQIFPTANVCEVSPWKLSLYADVNFF